MDQAYSFDFSWFAEYFPRFIYGALLTLKLMTFAAAASFVIGLIAGQMRMTTSLFIRIPAAAYIDFFRTTPLLVQIVFIFFFLPLFFGIRTDAFTAGVIALSLNYGAFFAEIFRAGVGSLDRGQSEAALAIGMTPLQSLRRVIYPQAIRRMMPPIGSMFVSLLKDTSLLTILGVSELMNTAQNVGALTFRNIEVLFLVAMIYFILTYPIALSASWLHKRSSNLA
ncbi:MAG: amino acid ABC transporter permease [Proteobacteria bacterium]|nr:amino acid ABC transporter permease [Pseudomonadota bacterium]